MKDKIYTILQNQSVKNIEIFKGGNKYVYIKDFK